MKIALDTNVLACAEGTHGTVMRDKALDLIQRLPPAAVMLSAMDLTSDHGLTIWDSAVVAAAAQADCRLLLSEDLQDGFTWRGVTIANPFAATLHPILAALLTVRK